MTSGAAPGPTQPRKQSKSGPYVEPPEGGGGNGDGDCNTNVSTEALIQNATPTLDSLEGCIAYKRKQEKEKDAMRRRVAERVDKTMDNGVRANPFLKGMFCRTNVSTESSTGPSHVPTSAQSAQGPSVELPDCSGGTGDGDCNTNVSTESTTGPSHIPTAAQSARGTSVDPPDGGGNADGDQHPELDDLDLDNADDWEDGTWHDRELRWDGTWNDHFPEPSNDDSSQPGDPVCHGGEPADCGQPPAKSNQPVKANGTPVQECGPSRVDCPPTEESLDSALKPARCMHEKLGADVRQALGDSFPYFVAGGHNQKAREEVLNKVKKWTDGKFNVRHSHSNEDKISGDYKHFEIGCCCGSKASSGGQGSLCKWFVKFSRCQEGFVLTYASPAAGGKNSRDEHHIFPCKEGLRSFHNHEMFQSTAEANVRAVGMGKRIPDEVEHIASLLARGGTTPSNMHALLSLACEDKNLPVTFDVPHLRTKYIPSAAKMQLDCSGMFAELDTRRDATGLQHFWDVKDDGSNEIDKIWMEIQGGREEWAKGGTDNTLLFDPTHGTNCYKWKLCLFTVIGSTGKTVIVAFAVLEHESKEHFHWALQCFHKVFVVPPKAVFTDRDGKLEEVLDFWMKPVIGSWTGSQHFFCIWHISKNLYERLRGLFAFEKKGKAWRSVHDKFWRIVKNTDVSYRDRIDADWDGLVELVSNSARSNLDGLSDGLAWLNQLGQLKEKFAACFVWGTCTSGVKSTQRAESMHRAIKTNAHLNQKCTLLQLCKQLEDYCIKARDQNDIDAIRHRLRDLLKHEALPPLVASLRECITPFAFDLIAAQSSLSVTYMPSQVYEDGVSGDGTVTYKVSPPPKAEDGRVFPDLDAELPSDRDFDASGIGHEDFGLTERPWPRRVKICVQSGVLESATCSCQFGKSWGVGLCRHIIRVCSMIEGLQSCNVENFFLRKWREVPAEELASMTHELHKKSLQASAPQIMPGGSNDNANGCLTRYDRKQRLLPLTTSLLQLGSSSEAIHLRVYALLSEAVKEMSKLSLELGDKGGGKGGKGKGRNNSSKATASSSTASSLAARTSRRIVKGPKTLTSSATELPEGSQMHQGHVVHSKLSDVARDELQKAFIAGYEISPKSCLVPTSTGSPVPSDGELTTLAEVLALEGPYGHAMLGQWVAVHWNKESGWCSGRVLKTLGTADRPTPQKNIIHLHDDSWTSHEVMPNFCVHFSAGDMQNVCLYRCNCLNLFPHQDSVGRTLHIQVGCF